MPQVICGPPDQCIKLSKKFGKFIKMIIFDEADEMLADSDAKSMGNKLNQLCRDCNNAQITFFSATFGETAKDLAEKITNSMGVSKGKGPRESHNTSSGERYHLCHCCLCACLCLPVCLRCRLA